MPITYFSHIGVYGSLRKGGSRDFLEKVNCDFVSTILIPGALFDLGPFPGFSKSFGKEGRVVFDLFRFPKIQEYKTTILRELDQMENFLYNRVVLQNNGINFYTYEARDWVMEQAKQIPGDPADWIEWVKGKKNSKDTNA